MAGNSTATKTGLSPFQSALPAPPLDVPAKSFEVPVGDSLHVCFGFPGCMCAVPYAELYTGPAGDPENFLARVTLPNVCCNCMCKCGTACCRESVLPMTNRRGELVGYMRLERDCLLPEISVFMGEKCVGKVKCRWCCPTYYDVVETTGERSVTVLYRSEVCIPHKACAMFGNVFYQMYRACFCNRTKVEDFYMVAGGERGRETMAFDVINVRVNMIHSA